MKKILRTYSSRKTSNLYCDHIETTEEPKKKYRKYKKGGSKRCHAEKEK